MVPPIRAEDHHSESPPNKEDGKSAPVVDDVGRYKDTPFKLEMDYKMSSHYDKPNANAEFQEDRNYHTYGTTRHSMVSNEMAYPAPALGKAGNQGSIDGSRNSLILRTKKCGCGRSMFTDKYV